jgi:NAD(P)H-hydrate epimerase
LIYLLTTPENRKLVEKLKIQTAEFMPIDSSLLFSPIHGEMSRVHPSDREVNRWNDWDCILIGPGMGVSATTKRLTLQVLKSSKKTVLDADALNMLDDNLKKLLSPQHILTPHHKEFFRLFKVKGNPENASKMAKKYHCHIVLKGHIDVIASPDGKIALNKTGNAGMTKGGTGDVLAGLIAGFYSTNDAFTSAAAGVYVNGLAGDELYKKSGTFYNAEGLMQQIPKTLFHLTSKA